MIRRFVIATLAPLLGAAVVVLPATPAHAIASCGTNQSCTYLIYSDSQHTTLIGEIFISCNGTRTTWGDLRGYEVAKTAFC